VQPAGQHEPPRADLEDVVQRQVEEGHPCALSDRPAPSRIAAGPAMAKNTTVPTKLMNVAIVASGTGTPARCIGPDHRRAAAGLRRRQVAATC